MQELLTTIEIELAIQETEASSINTMLTNPFLCPMAESTREMKEKLDSVRLGSVAPGVILDL